MDVVSIMMSVDVHVQTLFDGDRKAVREEREKKVRAPTRCAVKSSLFPFSLALSSLTLSLLLSAVIQRGECVCMLTSQVMSVREDK